MFVEDREVGGGLEVDRFEFEFWFIIFISCVILSGWFYFYEF